MSAQGRGAFDPRAVAEGTLDRCCEGDPWPTSRNLARFLASLARLAAWRCCDRVRNQPRSVVRCSRDARFGGRA